MLHHDPGVHSVNATLALVDRPEAPVPLHGASSTMRSGKAMIRGMVVASPTAGQYVLTLRALDLADATIPVYIRSGAPALLYIITEPAPVTDNEHPLTIQPVLGLQDSAGNVVQGDELQVTSTPITASFSSLAPPLPHPHLLAILSSSPSLSLSPIGILFNLVSAAAAQQHVRTRGCFVKEWALWSRLGDCGW